MKRAGAARRALVVSLTAGLIGALAVMPAASIAAKKKKKSGGTVDITKAVGLVVPDRGPAVDAPFGALNSTITVGGKQFKGMKVRDVNVTVQATGTGTDAINDLRARLTAPNGATSTLFQSLDPGNLLGPLTLDDESSLFLDTGTTLDDPQSLFAPWIGTAQPGSDGVLYPLDGGGVSGNWTLKLVDRMNTDESVLTSWRLNVTTGRAFQTK